MQGRAAEAISCYEHVALLQPESPEAHANLASAYKDAARQDTAIQRYQQVQPLFGGLLLWSAATDCCMTRPCNPAVPVNMSQQMLSEPLSVSPQPSALQLQKDMT